jgi:hypothetical protein
MSVQHEIDAANVALRRSTYSNFANAGLDLFTTGVSQDPDSYSVLQNVMPAENGGFRRRWGLKDKIALPVFHPVRTFPFNATQDGSDTADTVGVDLLISTDNQNWQVASVTSTGAATPLTDTLSFSAFTGHGPANFAHSGSVYGVGSRRWFYSSNGVDAPRKVNPGYTTANTESNWGIAAPAAYFRDNDTDTTAISTIAAIGGTGTGYTSPTVTISGGGGTGATASAILKNGMIVGFSMTAEGSGYTSAPSVEISDSGSGTGASAVAVYNDQGVISAVLPSGPIVLNQGRTYTYAWKNSISGHASGLATGIQSSTDLKSYVGNAATVLSPALGVIGNVPNGRVGFTQIVVTITPVGIIDPQVDTCVLLATADGGDLEKLYEVKQLPINPASPGTLTVTDVLPDTITDQSLAGSSGGHAISMSGVHAKVYAGDGSGIFSATSGDTPWFEQDFNSLMFNSHPVVLTDGFAGILPGYGDTNANQHRPFQNQATTALGTWSNDVPVAGSGHSAGATGPDFNFQMILTGTFHVAAPGNVTFNVYCDAAHLAGIDGATHVSGLQVFGGVTTTPLNGYPSLFGQNDDTTDWHFTASDPKVVNFPAAGDYPFEICYATHNHDERQFAMLANNSVLIDTGDSAINYEGLTLLNANLWVDTDSYGSLFGIVSNDPPPTNLLYPTAHQGRIFATDGLNVFFSKSIDEVTTSTGLITSKWEEAWPSDNVLPIALNNERVLGLKSDGTNLHIGTDQSIYTLSGTSPTDFSIPNMLFQQTGILSQDTWTVIYAEGEPAGFMWITPDLKMMYSDFSTYHSVGDMIYAKLQLWDSTYTQNAKMTSFTYGPLSLVALAYKPTTSAIAEYLIFDTKMKKWYEWLPQNRANSGALSTFVYQHPETGYRGLFFIETDAIDAWYRLFDPTATNDTGSAIPWTVCTNWQSLADPNTLKTINEIEVGTEETTLTATLYGARTQADLSSPVLLKTGPLTSNPLHIWKFFTAASPTNARWYRFQFGSGGISFVPNVLTYFAVQHYPQARF